jgi:hypothetical protein
MDQPLILRRILSFFILYDRFKFVLVCKKWKSVIMSSFVIVNHINDVQKDEVNNVMILCTSSIRVNKVEIIGQRTATYSPFFSSLEYKVNKFPKFYEFIKKDALPYRMRTEIGPTKITYLCDTKKNLKKIQIEERLKNAKYEYLILKIDVSLEQEKIVCTKFEYRAHLNKNEGSTYTSLSFSKKIQKKYNLFHTHKHLQKKESVCTFEARQIQKGINFPKL